MLNPRWIMAPRHGAEILEVLRRLDDANRAEQEQNKQAKAAKRRQDTEMRQAGKKRQQAEDHEQKRIQREIEKAEKDRCKEEERVLRQRQRDASWAERERLLGLSKPKQTAHPVPVGSSIFNVGSSLTVTPGKMVCGGTYCFLFC
jgi:hypothetical protein